MSNKQSLRFEKCIHFIFHYFRYSFHLFKPSTAVGSGKLSVFTISQFYYDLNRCVHMLKIPNDADRPCYGQTSSPNMAASTSFQFIVLRETDVPGAKLVYKSVKNIQIYNFSRGLAVTGELIQR